MRFDTPNVEKKWLTTPEAREAYTYLPAEVPIPGLGGSEGEDDPLAWIKLFDPAGSWTWYLLEADRETGEAFGLVKGFEVELGYISLEELAGVHCAFGLLIERDIHFEPTPLSKLREGK
jgi:hypothetical protein